ncbi:MAG: PEPxxWA-CTERM sorting domain-containing protein [Caulobacterales bacterium]|nr:PEPxxWA-CTERM sorting domain-containing protein [Caulobacterales bacterium]
MRTSFRALLATAALAAVAALAAPASASVSVSLSNTGDPNGLPAGQVLIADFNDAGAPTATLLPGVTLSLGGATVGVCEGCGGYSGTLPNDPTHYLTIASGKSATFQSLRALSTFSLYMGSPDTYNSIEFFGAGGYHETLSGADMFLGDTNQSWSWGKRVNFDFGGFKVDKVVLSSSGNSFEVDNAAGTLQAVPEPAAWALMILGFGAAGAMMRRQRALALA